jgi:Zn-dependent peptidase ImmA (M78 family)
MIEAAGRIAPLVDGDRIRLARELQGWTQQQLVSAANHALTTAALSQIEKGHTRPSARTLAALASTTGCPLGFFVARPHDRAPAGFFRSLRAASARDRRQYLARARLLHDFVSALEEYVTLPELDLPRFTLPTRDTREIENVAESVRARWGIGDGPLKHVIRTIERRGVVVVRVDEFTREIDAFSVCFEERPVIVLGSEKGVTARSRFDAAHELAHLVLHSDAEAGTKETEREAHEFAAAFLMPASAIRAELPRRADWSTLMRLKTKWRVSMQALLRRSLTLEVMSHQRYVAAMKAVSARGWRANEPGDKELGPLEAPSLLPRALEALEDGRIGWEDVADGASLPIDEIRLILSRTRNPRPNLAL